MNLPKLIVFSTLTTFAMGLEVCQDFSPSPDGLCTEVTSWSQFLSLLPSANELLLCPFDITKEVDDSTAVIDHGISIRCMRRNENDACIFRGPGTHLRISTADETMFQGLSFRDSDDYAVHVVSDAEGAHHATHTFCHCSLIE
jgi:hypothetical protein